MAAHITAEQTRDFARDGYLMVHQPIFPPEEFARIKAYVARRFAEETEKAQAAGKDAPSLIDCPHWSDPQVFDWLFADAMLALVEPIIGPDIAVFASHLLQKPPAVGKRVPWHEDSAYWKGVLKPMTVASVTLSLEPSTPENGCLRVIPGSHRHGYSEYAPVENPEEQVFGSEIRADQMDEAQGVEIILQPNEASLHDGRIIHGSAPNKGLMPRSALTVRYFPTTVKFVPEAQPYFNRNFPIYLARGRDKAGNTYGDPAQPYAPAPIY